MQDWPSLEPYGASPLEKSGNKQVSKLVDEKFRETLALQRINRFTGQSGGAGGFLSKDGWGNYSGEMTFMSRAE